jgi:hypothetical protein
MNVRDLLLLVEENINRRVCSNVARNEAVASLLARFGNLSDDEAVHLSESFETSNALVLLNSWFREMGSSIESACFFGSVVSGSTWAATARLIKDGEGNYRADEILVGPSDVDAVVLVRDEGLPAPPSFPAQCSRIDLIGSERSEPANLLQNVKIVLVDRWSSALFGDRRLTPLYWRMLCRAGAWVRESAQFTAAAELTAVGQFGSIGALEAAAAEFNWRRVDALLAFLGRVVRRHADDGFVYGTGWNPLRGA